MKISVRSSPRSRMVYSSQDYQRPKTAPSQWEITERIESCELRCKTSSESIVNKITYWKNCCSDILPLLQKDTPDIATNITRLTKGIFTIFETIQETWTQKIQHKDEEIRSLYEDIKNLNTTINKLKAELMDNEKIKLNHELRIKSEVEDMFGADENEIREMRLRSKRLMDCKPSGVVSMLKDIYADMSQTRVVPEMNEFEIDSPDPNDIAKAFRKNYQIILQSATKNALNMLRKDAKYEDTWVQTHIPCITEDEYEEIKLRFEKTNVAFQSALMQNDKMKEDLAAKSTNADRLEQEKNQLFCEMLNSKREAENATKELSILKKEFHVVSSEKEKVSKDLEIKAKQLIAQDEKLQSQAVKIKKLSQVPKKIENKAASNTKSEDPSAVTEKTQEEQPSPYPSFEGNRRISILSDQRRPRGGSIIDKKAILEPQKNLYKKYSGSISNYASNNSFQQENELLQNDINNFPGLKETKRVHYPKEGSWGLGKKTTVKDDNKELKHEKTIEKNNEKIDSGDNQDNLKRVNRKNKGKKHPIIKRTKSGKKDSAEEKDEVEGKADRLMRIESLMKENEKVGMVKEETKSVGQGTKGNFETFESLDEDGQKRQVERDGKIVELMDKANNTNLTMQAGINVGVQYNFDQLSDSEIKSRSSSMHMMPFNPNNFYGLKGDVFYNSSSKVFSAQPRNSGIFNIPNN